MKVPHQILGRTRPTSAGLDPLRVQVDPDAFGAGIARGIQGIAAGVGVWEQQVKEREDKTNRFQAMTNYSDFEISFNEELAELKKNADPTGKGFTALANERYEAAANKFLGEKVVPEMREEARYWLSNTKQRIIGDSMTFQYEAGNAFFRAGVDKEYQRALKGLDPSIGGNPAALEEYRASLNEAIDATDLSTIEKEKLKWDTSVGLEGVVYKQAKKVQMQTGGGGVKGLIRREEGFRNTPYWDVNAWRVGYGSDTITRADGSVVKVQPGMSVSREDAERDLDRRINTEFMPKAASQIGQREWGALSGNAKAALASVAYNYGSLPNSVVNAAKSGSTETLAAAVENLSANKDRRAREADLIRRGGETAPETDVDNSPLFSHLPYEDRVSLSKDAETEFNRDAVAAAEAEKLRVNTLTNDLLNKINDGLAGQTEIDAARAEGWLTDYDTIAKAQKLYESKNEETLLVQNTLSRLGSGQTFDPTSEDDKKGLNAVIGKAGLGRIDAMDQDYMSNGVIPMVNAAQDIPTDVVGLLTGMIRSNNQTKGLWAFEALAMMQDQAPEAFDHRVTDAVAADVNFYRQNRNAMPADELFERVNGGRTQAERQGRALLYQEAQDNLKAKKEGVATISSLVSEVVSGYDGWSASAEQIGSPAFAKQLMFDYEQAYTDYYVTRKPDHDEAAAWATKQIQKDWAVSKAGGGILMKYPPEQVGYPKVDGSYDWMEEQARAELGLGPDDTYQLVSDDITANEVIRSKAGVGPAPSYQVVTVKDGVPRLRMFSSMQGPKGAEELVESNRPARIRFQKTAEHKAMENLSFELNAVDAKVKELNSEIGIYLRSRTPPPLELTQEIEELRMKREALTGQLAEEFPAKPVPELPPEEQPWRGLPAMGFTPGAM